MLQVGRTPKPSWTFRGRPALLGPSWAGWSVLRMERGTGRVCGALACMKQAARPGRAVCLGMSVLDGMDQGRARLSCARTGPAQAGDERAWPSYSARSLVVACIGRDKRKAKCRGSMQGGLAAYGVNEVHGPHGSRIMVPWPG